MKRTIPLLITAICGFAIAAALFIPQGQEWGERVATWFDILAAIAFILGGGNLLKMQLKKISDRVAGWGYAVVTLVAFLVTLIVGLGKFGVPAAADQEFYGQVFASLALEDFPDGQVATVAGTIPDRADGEELPRSVRRQISEDEQAGTVSFRGWMNSNQRSDLLGYEDTLEWRCTVERLSREAQPPEDLQGKAFYHADHEALAVKGYLEDETRDRLGELGNSEAWNGAVAQLANTSRYTTSVSLAELPDDVDPQTFPEHVSYDRDTGELTVEGPMTPEQRDTLRRQFPLAKPLGDEERQQLRQEIERRGVALNEQQVEGFQKVVEGTWTADQLIGVLDEAGKAPEMTKSACVMLAEKRAGVEDIEPKIRAGADRTLNGEQRQAVRDFAEQDEMSVSELVERLNEAGTFNDQQESALRKFVNQNRTVGERNKAIWRALLSRENPLSDDQRDFLLGEYRAQQDWQAKVSELFYASHRAKFHWSGSYRAPGSPFSWIYEYAFKPLTATMFAMLAFFVASAAFRAFRAKNVEASLLLGTAFIILLGRTFAGVWLTDFIPATNPWLSWLRLEELTVFIMQVFNTAGNRAIMIGIALGIASTSLKILLGIDRSYLGSREE